MEKRVLALVLTPRLHVVVAEHRVEIERIFQQGREGLLEVLCEIPPAAIRVDIVACRYYEIHSRTAVRGKHLRRCSERVPFARAPVANYRESYLVFHRRAEH